MYYDGHGVGIDYKKAMDIFLEAESKRDWFAACSVGMAIMCNSFYFFFKTLFFTGRLYLYGKGVEKDEQKSMEWFNKAVEYDAVDIRKQIDTQNPDTQFMIGMSLLLYFPFLFYV